MKSESAIGRAEDGDWRPSLTLLRLGAVALVALVTFVSWLSSRRIEQANDRAQNARLADAAQRTKSFILERHAAYRQILNGVTSLFHIHGQVSAEDFRDYVRSL